MEVPNRVATSPLTASAMGRVRRTRIAWKTPNPMRRRALNPSNCACLPIREPLKQKYLDDLLKAGKLERAERESP